MKTLTSFLSLTAASLGSLAFAQPADTPAHSGGDLPAARSSANDSTAQNPAVQANDRAALFQRLDHNRDGRLSRSEFADSFALVPHTGSGVPGTSGVSSSLANTGDAPALFDKLDTNHDGQLSTDEFAGMPSRKTGAVTTEKAADLSRTTGANAGVPSLEGGNHSALFEKLDYDHDKALDAKEFSKMNAAESGGDPATLFRKLDTDGDGKVSREEFLNMAPTTSAPSNGKPRQP